MKKLNTWYYGTWYLVQYVWEESFSTLSELPDLKVNSTFFR